MATRYKCNNGSAKECKGVQGSAGQRHRFCYCLALLVLLAFTFHLSPFTLSAQTRGIDVSKFQGTINWTKVAKDSTIKFVYIKATEGTSNRDPQYATNIKKAKKAGLLVGSYHVYSSKTTAYQQMGNFKKMVKKKEQDLVPVLDIEGYHSGRLNMERVDKLLELMQQEYGVRPMIYTSEHLYKNHFAGKKYRNYHFFIAKYVGGSPSARHTLWHQWPCGHEQVQPRPRPQRHQDLQEEKESRHHYRRLRQHRHRHQARRQQ